MRRDWKHVLIGVVLIVVLGPMWLACGPTNGPYAPTEAPAEPTEAPAEPAEPPAEPSTVRFLMSSMAQGTDWLAAQIETFMADNPDITVELDYRPSDELVPYLQVQLAAGGTLPDVLALSYNQLAELQWQGMLAPLTGQVETDDFLPEAIDFATIDGDLYGLPWWRDNCLSYYEDLALLSESQEPDAAFSLMGFLAQQPLQTENYLDLGLRLYPTLYSVYSEQNIACPDPTGHTVLLEPEFVAPTIDYVQGFWPNLTPVLEGQTINSSQAAALLDDQGSVVAAAAPVKANYSEAELADGVVIGALSVNSDGYRYPPGDYAIKCQGVDNTQCELRPAQGDPLPADVVSVQVIGSPVVQPIAALRTGSWFHWCFPVDGRDICIDF